jgi:hypothetical protein
VIAAALPARRRHEIDYRGGTPLPLALTTSILFTSLGGISFAWTSPIALSLIGVSIVSAAGLVMVEWHAREPLLPMSLFRNRNFVVASSVGLIVGLSLFGSVTFLPIYLQVAKGVSPSVSGLMLMPMMFGMLITSILSGRINSGWGRYKLFPVAGTALGLVMLSRLSLESHRWQTSLDALWLGLGMGMVMQVLVLAVQNSRRAKRSGVGTCAALERVVRARHREGATFEWARADAGRVSYPRGPAGGATPRPVRPARALAARAAPRRACPGRPPRASADQRSARAAGTMRGVPKRCGRVWAVGCRPLGGLP